MLEKILIYHAQRYPLMEPADAVKLVYQNEFGIGHMISDYAAFLERLVREMHDVRPEAVVPLTEPIGNGLARVNLNSRDISGMSAEKLAEYCFLTARSHEGSEARFEEKLHMLETACEEGRFGFSPQELERYLSGYRKEGFHPVSHSRIYHDAYHPAYQVVIEKLLFR